MREREARKSKEGGGKLKKGNESIGKPRMEGKLKFNVSRLVNTFVSCTTILRMF